jgi:hypothetical protein
MARRRIKRPRDIFELSKLIGDIATGQVQDAVEDGKDPSAVSLGKKGGLKGGKARAASLTPTRRKAIARAAAKARWQKKIKKKK